MPPKTFGTSFGDKLKNAGVLTPKDVEKKQVLAETFKKVLKGRFQDIKGEMMIVPLTDTPVEHIIISSPAPHGALMAETTFRLPKDAQGGKVPGKVVFTITPEGLVLGEVPKVLEKRVSKDGILRAILERLEVLGFKDIVMMMEELTIPEPPASMQGNPFATSEGTLRVDARLFPTGEALHSKQADEEEDEDGDGEDDNGTIVEPPEAPPLPPDARRIDVIKKQRGYKFDFQGSKGFAGYRGHVFPSFVVMECDRIGNACYIIDTEEEIEPPAKASREEMKEFVETQSWFKQLIRSRREALKAGAERIEHQGSWVDNIEEAIRYRMDLYDRRKAEQKSRAAHPPTAMQSGPATRTTPYQRGEKEQPDAAE